MTDFIASLGGAFFGALAAFALEAFRAWKIDRAKQICAIIRTQAALARQLDTVRQINDRLLSKEQKHASRHLRLPHFDASRSTLAVNYDAIEFIINHDLNLMMGIELAERYHSSVFDSISLRNDAFKKLRENSKIMGYDTDGTPDVQPNDQRFLSVLKKTTDALYANVESAIYLLEVRFKDVREFGQKQFPNHEFPNLSQYKPKQAEPT